MQKTLKIVVILMNIGFILTGCQQLQAQNHNYSNQVVASLDIDIEAADLTIWQGEEFTVKIENTSYSNIECSLKTNGTLHIGEKNIKRGFNSNTPKIFITIPKGSHFTSLSIKTKLGTVSGNNLDIRTNEAVFFVGTASTLELSGITSSMTRVKANSGEVVLSGTFTGHVKIECDLASTIDFHTTEAIEEYSYDAQAFMGSISINRHKLIDDFGKQNSGSQKSNHFDITCTMGDIRISTE